MAVPAAYFASRGMVNGALGRRLALLFLMGGTQGLVGWWMVRSGFQVRADQQYKALYCLIHLSRRTATLSGGWWAGGWHPQASTWVEAVQRSGVEGQRQGQGARRRVVAVVLPPWPPRLSAYLPAPSFPPPSQ